MRRYALRDALSERASRRGGVLRKRPVPPRRPLLLHGGLPRTLNLEKSLRDLREKMLQTPPSELLAARLAAVGILQMTMLRPFQLNRFS